MTKSPANSNQDKWEKEIKPLLYPYMDTDDYEVAIAFIKRLLTSQKERMVDMVDGMFGEDRNAPIVKEVVDDIIKKLEAE